MTGDGSATGVVVEPGAVRPRLRPHLRPGVAVTPLREGLHLRGRGTGLTLEGSRALPELWKLLAARLAPGPEAAEPVTEPKVAAALATVTARLREHDLIVDHPAGARLPDWPGAVADEPGVAAAALAAARPVVAAADPDGPLGRAVAQALAAGGTAAPTVVAEPGLPPGRVVASAGEPPVAVAVQCGTDGGFVTEPADPGRARADATALAARLGSDPGTVRAVSALPVLLAAAAAQRLLCAVAGLPDPGEPGDDPRLLGGRPAVLLAEARPPRAEHHPWAAGPGPVAAPPGDLAEALRRVTALGDARLGVLDAPSPGGLPQLPAALVSCGTPTGTLVAGAARTDLARLAAACRSAELHLAAVDGGTAPVVGADPDHALGRALRRAALARAVPTGPALPEAVWREHPQAAHWWETLARCLGRSPELTVRQFTDARVFQAEVEGARALEATPADAVAHAALAALTRLLARSSGLTAAHHTALTGAAAPLAAAGRHPAAWTDEGWTDRWLAELADHEADLRADLGRLTGLRTTPWRPATPAARAFAGALDGCGFTALVPAPGPASVSAGDAR
ncbi:hypothetical protein GCM10018790_62310 [Kitasatospora xanthocidica]|uniref:hypothetical protein n=1 Tax=Kitasatospora xanthocidica TaxID=83382 RepID=UPI0016790AE4|nr:hypothetical protein [Kitasatospora xanthocidica]GHF75912.1 hypothetical protein GCM10018790_62310 [Kitasatospora xanthocidica]